MTDTVKNHMNLKLELAINNELSWGELFQFVDLARAAGIDPTELVGVEYDERDESILNGLSVYLTPEDLSPGGGAAAPSDGGNP